MSKKNDQRENVVIVGGGFLGTLAARTLSTQLDASKYNLILINERPYTLYLISALRMVVTKEGNLEEQSLIPFDKLFVNGNGTFKLGRVTAIEETAPGKGGAVVLQDGEKIPYAALVLATGASWPAPIDFPEADHVVDYIKTWRKRFEQAQDIYLVGGGAVGIETAGELRDTYPNKKITIIQRDRLLLNATYPDKFHKNLEGRLRERGVNIVFNESVDTLPEFGTKGLVTQSGKEFPSADLVVPTYGPRVNTAFISSLGSDVLTGTGTVKINPTFELQAHPGVFAIGDIIEWKEQKQAGKAAAHLGVAVPNLLSYLAGRPLAKVYKGSIELIAIPIGKDGGAFYADILWGIQLGGWFVRLIKGKDLFVPKARADRGY
ncbi:hypothetical protein B0H21DRAFT_807447 [Amylocystis lapponica]|nr:hypothetical protein B0H21DRAFT_807447 [Amylocystis lapponica]